MVAVLQFTSSRWMLSDDWKLNLLPHLLLPHFDGAVPLPLPSLPLPHILFHHPPPLPPPPLRPARPAPPHRDHPRLRRQPRPRRLPLPPRGRHPRRHLPPIGPRLAPLPAQHLLLDPASGAFGVVEVVGKIAVDSKPAHPLALAATAASNYTSCLISPTKPISSGRSPASSHPIIFPHPF